MKTLRKEPIELLEVGVFPPLDQMKPNVMYYNERIKTGVHFCLCGCGELLGIGPGWEITSKSPLTIVGSIQHEDGCRSHYIITKGIANFV